MQKLKHIVDDTIKALEEMKRSGVTHVEVSQATLEELGRKPVVVAAVPAAPTRRTPVAGTAAATPDWAALEAETKKCRKCAELARTRRNVVFGVGNPQAELMFIGEAPGADEDAQGEPFVGRAGQLLTKIIEAMGMKREEVYIANVLKCRPPENRTPLPDETANCLPYLQRQIEMIRPKVIVALGATALRALLDIQIGITKMRGNWYAYHDIPIMPTFHPAYLLRNPPAKKEVWQDMKTVLAKLGREVPKQS
ncbi:MAG: uracil-DNA glycosylase [Verrucomicrobia bacterium]|nr:uracil-DNA glycosylase [Verrucomicrobiota bacterium]